MKCDWCEKESVGSIRTGAPGFGESEYYCEDHADSTSETPFTQLVNMIVDRPDEGTS
jgi:hypothetical protein